MDAPDAEGMLVQVVGPRLPRRATEFLLQNELKIAVRDHAAPWVREQVSVVLGLTTPATRQFLQAHGAARTVVVTSESEMHTGLFRQYGLTVFVGEQDDATDLHHAIYHAARGVAYCSPSLIAPLIEAARHSREEAPPPAPALSEREREVGELALDGWPNDKIAAHLHVSVSTVKYHLFNAYRKLGVRRRVDLAKVLGYPRDRPHGQEKTDRVG